MRKWKIGIRGPLAADLPAVCAALEARGYTRLSIRNLARLLAHLSRWLADHQLGAGDLTRETIDRFVRDRRAAGYTAHRCASSLEPLLEYLRAVGTAPRLAPLPRIATPNDATLDAYRMYLTRERDLAPATARFYLHVAQAVLPGDGDLTRLTAHTVPLHPTTVEALRTYAAHRNTAHPRPRSPSFFLTIHGTRPHVQNVWETFARLRRLAGLPRGPRAPRIHDLRHSFAMDTVLRWSRQHLDIHARLPLLSTYLGHVGPSSTYWYLTATPALLELAAQRVEPWRGTHP